MWHSYFGDVRIIRRTYFICNDGRLVTTTTTTRLRNAHHWNLKNMFCSKIFCAVRLGHQATARYLKRPCVNTQYTGDHVFHPRQFKLDSSSISRTLVNAWHLDGFSSGALSLPARINVVLEGHRQVKVCFRNLYQTSPTNQTWHLQPGMQAWRQKLKTSSHMHEDFFF